MGVPEIVEPDALHPGGLRCLQHLPAEVMLREWEQPVIRSDVVERCHVLQQLCRQLRGHRNHPAALWRLRLRDDLLAVDALEGLRDGQRPGVQVQVPRREGQQLAYPQAGPEQHRQPGPGRELADLLMDGRELLDGPEVHLVRVFLPDATGQAGRIDLEAVVADGVVEDGADLIVNGLDVGGGQTFGQKVGLPLADVRRGNLVERQLPEERQDLRIHQVPLVLEGVRLEAALHVVEVYLDHGPEGHVAAPGLRAEKFLLEGLCVLLAEEAPLLLEAAAPLPVRVVKRCVPGAPFLVFVGGQFFLHLRDMCKSCHTRPRSAQERVSGASEYTGTLGA